MPEKRTTASASAARAAAPRIALDELTEAAMSGVLRALDARARGREPFGPIIVGIIAYPEAGQFGPIAPNVSGLKTGGK